jgi:CyaY protein
VDEARFDQLAAGAFKRLLAGVDRLDPDTLEAEDTGDALTLTAASGERCVINTRRAVRQIWVAGTGQGVHFSYDEREGTWKDDKGRGLELFRFVAEIVQAISQATVSF